MPRIAKVFGVSRQRIKQVLNTYIPEWREQYGPIVNKRKREAEYFTKWGNKQPTELYASQRDKFRAKKANAIRNGYDWTVTFGELHWPTHCPILGMEINYFSESVQESSPSFDRTDNNLGYIPGNVGIISWRANRIKNNGTADEHRRIAAYLDSLYTDNVDSQVGNLV